MSSNIAEKFAVAATACTVLTVFGVFGLIGTDATVGFLHPEIPIQDRPFMRFNRFVSRGIATVEKPFADPDKLGWMDEKELSPSDMKRIAEIKGLDFGSQLNVIGAMRAGSALTLSRRDFELMRQDRRRAEAAYPDVPAKTLFKDFVAKVDLSAEVPDSFCPSWNSQGTEKDGKWYLDGSCLTAVVAEAYPNHANAKTTNDYFAAKKAKQRAAKLERLKTNGPYVAESGNGGSLTVKLDKATNEVLIIHADYLGSRATQWRIPFVAEQWVDINPGDLDSIKKLPEFATAKKIQIDTASSDLALIMGPTRIMTVSQQPLRGGESGATCGKKFHQANLHARGMVVGCASAYASASASRSNYSLGTERNIAWKSLPSSNPMGPR